MQRSAIQCLERLEQRSIALIHESGCDVEPIVRVDADQVCIEGCMVNLREWNAVWNHGLPQFLVAIGDYMRRIQQHRLRQTLQGAPSGIGTDYGLAERGLVQALFDGTHGIAPLGDNIRHGSCIRN